MRVGSAPGRDPQRHVRNRQGSPLTPLGVEPSPEIAATRPCLAALLAAVGLFSGFVNLLMLTGPLFMLQVYDRVLASRPVATLFALVGMLFAFRGVLAASRARRAQFTTRQRGAGGPDRGGPGTEGLRPCVRWSSWPTGPPPSPDATG